MGNVLGHAIGTVDLRDPLRHLPEHAPVIHLLERFALDVVEREAFQEMDYRRMFGQMAKWVAQIDRADRVPEYISHAFHTAVSGRPGPVVLALPEDMQTDMASVPDTGPYQRVAAHPGPKDMQKRRGMLAQAKQPMVILGGGGWNRKAVDDMQAFVTAFNLPV